MQVYFVWDFLQLNSVDGSTRADCLPIHFNDILVAIRCDRSLIRAQTCEKIRSRWWNRHYHKYPVRLSSDCWTTEIWTDGLLDYKSWDGLTNVVRLNTLCRALTDRRCHTPAVTQPQPYPCSRKATPAQAKVAIWAATLAPSQAGATLYQALALPYFSIRTTVPLMMVGTLPLTKACPVP